MSSILKRVGQICVSIWICCGSLDGVGCCVYVLTCCSGGAFSLEWVHWDLLSPLEDKQ